VTFTKEFADGQHVAVVMAEGPGRGSADVSVDGTVVGTVDTRAAVNDNRLVVFDWKMTAGVHSVTVANSATPGHPRIDIDAFMT
jgi:hypothetical protein